MLNISPKTAKKVVLNVRGTPIVYDCEKKQLSAPGAVAAVEPADGCLSLRLLVDRSSIEIFTGDGRANMAFCFLPRETTRRFRSAARAARRRLGRWMCMS